MLRPSYNIGRYGLLRTDQSQPGYGKATTVPDVIKLAAQRARLREQAA